RHHHGAGGKIPDQDVSHQPRLRVHGDARFRPQLPDAGADPARRHPGASLCGCDGGRDASAERRGEHVPVEGTEGADSARGAADPLLTPRTPARGGVKASLRAKIGRMGKGTTIATKLTALTRLIPARAGRCPMKTIAI